MTTKSGLDKKTVIMLIVFTILIFSTLYLLTTNTEVGTLNQDTNNISCEQYDLNAVECPLNNNQSNQVKLDSKQVSEDGR